ERDVEHGREEVALAGAVERFLVLEPEAPPACGFGVHDPGEPGVVEVALELPSPRHVRSLARLVGQGRRRTRHSEPGEGPLAVTLKRVEVGLGVRHTSVRTRSRGRGSGATTSTARRTGSATTWRGGSRRGAQTPS